MRTATRCAALILVAMGMASALTRAYTEDFAMEKSELSATGRNPYFVLEPGYQLLLESGDGTLSITVLHETKTLDSVETRVVEERESKNKLLVEVSRNYFAISKRTGCVFYFGEDVDMYGKDGNVVSHERSWYAGENGAKPGLMMPGRPLLGARYCQELAPKTAMDRAEIVSVDDHKRFRSADYVRLLKTEETSPLEPHNREYKWYAPGIGLVKDGEFELVKYGMPGK